MCKESGFLRWNLLLVKMVGMATKDLEYYKNLVDKAAARSERTDLHFQRSSPVAKMLSSSIASSREIVYERKSRSMQQTSLLPHFKILPHQPQPSVSSHQHWSETLHQQKYTTCWMKAPMTVSIFSAIKYLLIRVCTFLLRYNAAAHLIEYSST